MWPTLIPILGNLLDKLFPDPAAAAAAKLEVMKMAQNGELAQLDADVKLAQGQMEINQVEAANPSLLVSGGRPFVLWTCGVALAYVAIIEPIARFVATVFFHYTGEFPAINTDITMQVLLGLLGLSGLRSYDKKQGTASK